VTETPGPASPATLHEWATVARMAAAWIFGAGTVLALSGIFDVVPPWWTCWPFLVAGWLSNRYARRLERQARVGER